MCTESRRSGSYLRRLETSKRRTSKGLEADGAVPPVGRCRMMSNVLNTLGKNRVPDYIHDIRRTEQRVRRLRACHALAYQRGDNIGHVERSPVSDVTTPVSNVGARPPSPSSGTATATTTSMMSVRWSFRCRIARLRRACGRSGITIFSMMGRVRRWVCRR